MSLLAWILLAALAPPAALERVALIATRQQVRATAAEAVTGASVRLSVPFAFEAQTPLALWVESRPPDLVRGLRLVEERDGRPLAIELAPLAAGDEVVLVVRALVLVAERDVDDLRGVRHTALESLPPEARAHLHGAPGIEPEDPDIAAIAAQLPRKDLHATVAGVLRFLEREIRPGSGPQGAKQVLVLRSAACTGMANLGASLLIAAGVPTRILPCILVGMPQQEHYIVEVWAAERGWTRVETTLRTYPPSDEAHVVLRVTHPDAPRSHGDVPSYLPVATPGITAHFEFFAGTSSFQEAHRVDGTTLDGADLELLVDAARSRLARLAAQAVPDARVQLVSVDEPPPRLGARGRKLLARLDEALADATASLSDGDGR